MGKKRERQEGTTDRGGDGDISMDQDRGAESLMFEIVASDQTSGTRPDGSSKRRKSSGTSAQPPPQGSNGNLDEDAAANASAEADAAATISASSYHPAAIAPSSALRQCDGFDVVRKGARGRGRQLMVLPGALGLGNGGSGGRLGSLNIATPASPVLFVEFPQVCCTLKNQIKAWLPVVFPSTLFEFRTTDNTARPWPVRHVRLYMNNVTEEAQVWTSRFECLELRSKTFSDEGGVYGCHGFLACLNDSATFSNPYCSNLETFFPRAATEPQLYTLLDLHDSLDIFILE